MKKIILLLILLIPCIDTIADAQQFNRGRRHHRRHHNRHHRYIPPASIEVIQLTPCAGMCYAVFNNSIQPIAGGQIENLPEAGPPEIAVFGNIVHTAYTKYFRGGVNYSKFDGTSWVSESIDEKIIVNASLVSIAVNSIGNPAVAYIGESPEGLNETIYVAVKQSDGTWGKAQITDGTTDVREHFKIMYDSNDKLHVVFHSWNIPNTGEIDSTWSIRHATNQSGSWATQIIYSYPDDPLSTTAIDSIMVNDEIHIVAFQWNYITLEGNYLYFPPQNNTPQIIRSVVSGTGLAYYRTLSLKKDLQNGIHLMSCLEIYSILLPGETMGYAAAIYTEYGYKPFNGDWGTVGFVHSEDIQYGVQSVFTPVSQNEVYQLTTYQSLVAPAYDEMIVMYRLQNGIWSRTDRVIPGPTLGSEILETADMAIVNNNIFVIYSQLETGTGDSDQLPLP